jgi:hypothetical protein
MQILKGSFESESGYEMVGRDGLHASGMRPAGAGGVIGLGPGRVRRWKTTSGRRETAQRPTDGRMGHAARPTSASRTAGHRGVGVFSFTTGIGALGGRSRFHC